MEKINEKLYIELYNLLDENGRCKYGVVELSKLFNISSGRIAEKYEQQLRKEKKIKFRKEIEKKAEEKYINQIIPSEINWKLPSSTKIAKKNNVFKKYLIIADTHVPYQNTTAIKSVLSLMDKESFDGFFILGDFMDMAPIAHWNKNKKLTSELKRLRKDYIAGNQLLDIFDKKLPIRCDKRYWYGNHEDWHNQFIEELPMLEGMLSPIKELHLKERGYTVYEDINHKEKIGKLWITHGMYHVENFVKKHIESFASNVLVAHMHTSRCMFSPSAVKDIALAGYSIGCLCNTNPDYLKNRPKAWSHGFGVMYLFTDGFFDVQLVRIINGKFIYNNNVYIGK